jgi:RNA polymerase sigma factor (sigma-70 family)
VSDPTSLPASSAPPCAAPANHARWFAEEIRPHEAALRVYLRNRFPTLRDYDDLIQETYARLIRVRSTGTITSAKSLLFTTARNAALDHVRHAQVISFEELPNLDRLAVFTEKPDAAETASRQQEFALLKEGIASLPDRCRQVITLRNLYGLSHREIAERLGMAEQTVSVHITRGVVRLREFLQQRGVTAAPKP